VVYRNGFYGHHRNRWYHLHLVHRNWRYNLHLVHRNWRYNLYGVHRNGWQNHHVGNDTDHNFNTVDHRNLNHDRNDRDRSARMGLQRQLSLRR